MKKDVKRTVIIFTVSALLIIVPFLLLIFIRTKFNLIYTMYSWLFFTLMVACWITSLVILLRNYKRMVTIEMLEGMKELIQSDREFFEYTGVQTNPYAYMMFLESHLIRDKYKIERDFKLDDETELSLVAVKKTQMPIKRTLLRAVVMIEADGMRRAAMTSTVTKLCDYLNASENEDLKADRRAITVMFIGRKISQNAKNYTKKIRIVKNGALVPVCIDLSEKRIYFMCGKMVKQSNEELAQKLVVRYVLGDNMERVPRNDGTEPMSGIQERAIKDIDKMMELNLKKEEAGKEKRKSDRSIYRSMKEGEIYVIDDAETVTVYYKTNNGLLMHVYDFEDYDEKRLKVTDYNILQVYPKYESIVGFKGEDIVESIEEHMRESGYIVERKPEFANYDDSLSELDTEIIDIEFASEDTKKE